MPAPTVSVVIPTYNCARFLADAVDSVLAQTFKDHEVIIVDDGSTDETSQVINRYGTKVRYIRQRNAGVSAARNLGISESTGRYISFLDSDDTWLPSKLDRQLDALQKQPGYRACYSGVIRVASDLSTLGTWRSDRPATNLGDLLTRGNVIGSVSVLCERSIFSEVGMFDLSLSQCADWDMWVRMATRTDFLYVDELLLTYRQHGSNMSHDPALLERDSIRVLEKGFALDCVRPEVAVLQRHAFARNYTVLAGTYFGSRQYSRFLRCAARAVSLEPRQVTYLAAYPLRLISRVKASRVRARIKSGSRGDAGNHYERVV